MILATYPSYRDSGVAWIGSIPSEWAAVPLWTLFSRVKRTGFENEELLSVYRDHGVVVRSSRSDNNNNASEDLSTYQLVEQGDLAINKMKAWQGSVAVSDLRGIVSPAYFIFRSQHRQHGRYLHYLMRSLPYIAAYARVSKGVRPNQWDLDPQQHSRLTVLLPPKDEQLQIANYLDAQTAKIDLLIEKQERLLEVLAERRQASIGHAVTKGLAANVPMKDSGISWLGQVPRAWPIKRVSWLFKTIGSGTTPPRDVSTYYGPGTPWVTTGELRETTITATAESVTLKALSTFPTLRVYEPGTLLIALYGATRGRLGTLGVAACTNQACCALSDPTGVDARFVHYSLLASREYLLVMAVGGSQQMNINQDTIRSLRLPTPSLTEQMAIVEHLDRETAQMDALSAKAREMIEVLKERRQALISAAVTGKIDVRGLS